MIFFLEEQSFTHRRYKDIQILSKETSIWRAFCKSWLHPKSEQTHKQNIFIFIKTNIGLVETELFVFASFKGILKEIVGGFKAYTVLLKNVHKRKDSSYGSRKHTRNN